MKVFVMAHGHPSLHKGGGEVAAYSVHRMLREAGHQSVYVGWGGQPSSPNGGSLTQVGDDDYLLYTHSDHFYFSAGSKNLREGLEALLASYQPDVVHLHHYIHIGIEIAAIVKQFSPKTRVVLTFHEYLAICANNGQLLTRSGEVCEGYKPERCNKCFPQTTPAGFFMREIAIKSALSFVDDFVSPSQFLADQYIKWGIPADRFTVVENPLFIHSAESAPGLAPPQKGERWKLGFFGQINYYKGLDIILQGVKQAVDQGAEVEVGVHGTFSAVNGEAYIEKLKEAMSLMGGRVKYHGAYKQSDVQSLMQDYHFVIMGSRWYENSPVVIQEAISAQVPLMVPNHGGMKEKVSGVGLLYEPGNPHALSKLLINLADNAYLKCVAETKKLAANLPSEIRGQFDTVMKLYGSR